MKLRVGMKAIFVRLLASERRNEVAEETGVSYASNSSVNDVISRRTTNGRKIHADGDPQVLSGISVPLLLLARVETELRESISVYQWVCKAVFRQVQTSFFNVILQIVDESRLEASLFRYL